METKNILLLFFTGFNISGFFLILLRTGDHDADMFTKILGWLLFAPSLMCLFFYYKWIGVLLFIIGVLIVIFIKYTILKREKKNVNTY
tara:strand:+ start:901 stop:1164 length:264 start_codon:yes stop_codon:yes gene_type:complete